MTCFLSVTVISQYVIISVKSKPAHLKYLCGSMCLYATYIKIKLLVSLKPNPDNFADNVGAAHIVV